MEKYNWKHLMEIEPRSSVTFGMIKPFLLPEHKVVLDVFCGFAPLHKHMADREYFGYDSSEEAISSLRRDFPRGNWKVLRDSQFSFDGKIDVFIHLGISAGERDTDSKIETEVDSRIIGSCSPSLVILEMCAGHYDRIKAAKLPHHWDAINERVASKYRLLASEAFDSGIKRECVAKRVMNIYGVG